MANHVTPSPQSHLQIQGQNPESTPSLELHLLTWLPYLIANLSRWMSHSARGFGSLHRGSLQVRGGDSMRTERQVKKREMKHLDLVCPVARFTLAL